VWGVNPRRREVLGRECVPTIADLPEAVDAVVVAIPAAGVAAVIDHAGARGCGGAVVFSAGFDEVQSGRQHHRAQDAVAAAFDLGGPVALKLSAAGVQHKTELGGRGRPVADLPAAAQLAARVGELLLERPLSTVECNPVLVGACGQGAVAVDAAIGTSGHDG
jgi:acyl-CoA synthetase (NDP forming)